MYVVTVLFPWNKNDCDVAVDPESKFLADSLPVNHMRFHTENNYTVSGVGQVVEVEVSVYNMIESL